MAPGNRPGEMLRKLEFYQRYGVEEYYLYDPEPRRLQLSGFLRREDQMAEISSMNGHVSPGLGIRFDMTAGGLRITGPDGRPFVTVEQLRADRDEQRRRADREQSRAEQERTRADQATSEVERLREQLRSLGQDPG